MSRFLFKATVFERFSRTLSHNSNVSCLRVKWFSVGSEIAQEHSITVSYLINSLGFSHNEALLSSKTIRFDSPKKPDKTVEFLKGYGFTQTQISSLIRNCPRLLLSSTEKTIQPKLEFFESKGLSRIEIAERLSIYPSVLTRNLKKHILPSYEFMRTFFGSDEKTAAAVKRHPDILAVGPERCIGPNAAILRDHGVSHQNIAKLILQQPRTVFTSPSLFRKVVEDVAAMGFDASKLSFVIAVIAIRSMKSSTWESKANVFKKWGWSNEEVLTAFEKEPRCMLSSEDKISACMDVLINKMCLRPCSIAKYPLIFSFSLEKRILPRFSVYQILLSKHLLKKELSLSLLFYTSEKKFLKRFVTCYEKEAPELLKLYEERMCLLERSQADKRLQRNNKRLQAWRNR